jgi:hypothetical protein
MRETSPRGWHRWRVTAVPSAVPAPFEPANRLRGSEPTPVVAGPAEAGGPDGIRHDLVARIRQQIADGVYDTEERWCLAEQALLRRIDGRA